MTYDGTSLPFDYNVIAYAGTSVPPWAATLNALFCEAPEVEYVECIDPLAGNRQRPKLRTKYVPRVTGKDVRRFGQNRGRY